MLAADARLPASRLVVLVTRTVLTFRCPIRRLRRTKCTATLPYTSQTHGRDQTHRPTAYAGCWPGTSRQRYGQAPGHSSIDFPVRPEQIPLLSGPWRKKKAPKISNQVYEAEIFRLQTGLVKLQEWTRQTGARVLVVFEGRDAGRQGRCDQADHRVSEPTSSASSRCSTSTERERGQWYFQRYIAHLPGRGEIVLFDRSWYNRAGVENLGFCTPEEYYRFLQTPIFEQMLIDDGIILRKYWFSVSDKEQLRRFRSRHADPVRCWKLSLMDVESINRWEDYSGPRTR